MSGPIIVLSLGEIASKGVQLVTLNGGIDAVIGRDDGEKTECLV